MAKFDARKEGTVSSEFLRTSRVADSRAVTVTSEQTLLYGQAAQFVFCVPGGSVVTLGGMDGATLWELVDQAEHVPDDRRALFVWLRPAGSVEDYVEQVIAVLAETAMRLWPVWFTDVSFAMCCDDALGRQAAGVIAREAAARTPGVSSTWAEAAARFALAGGAPRVAGVLPAIELAQLSLAVSRGGLVFVPDVSAAADSPSAAPDRRRAKDRRDVQGRDEPMSFIPVTLIDGSAKAHGPSPQGALTIDRAVVAAQSPKEADGAPLPRPMH